MSTDITMQELELETAELLPSRETLSNCGCRPSQGHGGFSLNQWNGSTNGSGDGNVSQHGGWGNVAIGGGNLDGNLSGNNVAIL